MPPTGWSKSLGSVQSSWYSALPRTVDPRAPSLNSIVLDQRRGQKVGPCLGKTTSGTELGSVQQGYGFCQSIRACVLPCPVPESAIFGYRRVPLHVAQYPWYRMRALDFACFSNTRGNARRHSSEASTLKADHCSPVLDMCELQAILLEADDVLDSVLSI